MSDIPDTQPSGPGPILEARRVRKSFDRQWAIDDASLSVDRGTTSVIIGPSGSGKSTFLRCLNLLESIDAGSILFHGEDISGQTERGHRIRERIAMVFQHFELFQHLSAIENIMLAPMKVRRVSRLDAHDQAVELLEKVHIPEKADLYPDELSGGQQQRVAIARALAMEPEIVLFDEPTSALDPEMIKEVLEVMVALSQGGLTSVVVTHEMGFAQRAADHVAFMENGRVVEHASGADFFGGQVGERARRFLDQIIH